MKVNLNSLFWSKEQVVGTVYRGNDSHAPSGRPVAKSMRNTNPNGARLSYPIMKALAKMDLVAGIGKLPSGEYVLEIKSDTKPERYLIKVDTSMPVMYHTCIQSNRGRVCYHMVMAYLAIMAAELDSSHEFQMAFRAIDYATLAYQEQEAFELAADAAYFLLKEDYRFGELEVLDALSVSEKVKDLTREVFNRDSDWTLVEAEIPVVYSTPHIHVAPPKLQWPKRDDLTPEEEQFVPRGIEYIPVDTELEDIYWHIMETRAQGLPCNIWLKGHASTAKTTLVKYICQEMNVPLFVVPASHNILEEQLLGTYTKIGDQWQWVDGLVPRAMRRGFALDFEEVATIQDTVAAVLHNILDESRFITLTDCPIDDLKFVKADPRLIVFATSNTGAGSGYTAAAKQMDIAFVSRWFPIYLQMPPVEVRVEILKKKTGFDNENILRRMVEAQDSFNVMYDNRQLRQVCTMRDLINWALHCKHFDPMRAAKRAIVDQLAFSEEERRDIINALETFF